MPGLIKQKGAVRKNSENVVRGSAPGVYFSVDGINDRAVIENFAVSADRVPGTPFANINAELKHMRLNGHNVFVAGRGSAHMGKKGRLPADLGKADSICKTVATR